MGQHERIVSLRVAASLARAGHRVRLLVPREPWVVAGARAAAAGLGVKVVARITASAIALEFEHPRG